MPEQREPRTAVEWKVRAAAAARDPDVSPEDVLSLYERALEMDPTMVGAWVGLGTTLAVLGRYPEALQAFERGLRIDPEHEECLARRVRVLEWMNAHAVRKELPEDLVESADSCFARAVWLRERGRAEEALRFFHKALDLDPKHRDSCEALAVTLLGLGQHAEALRYYDGLLARSVLDGKRLAHAQWGKGLCLRGLGRPRDALPWLDRAAKTMPGNIDLARDRAATVQAIRQSTGQG
jgi:tetratricopeptide (TPR) repeat protein